MAKEFLRSKGVPYQERDVSRDQAAAQEMMAKSGQMGVPVILAEDPTRPGAPDVIVGFDRSRLEQLASRIAAAGGSGGADATVANGGATVGSAAGVATETGHSHQAGHSHQSDDSPRLGLRVKDDPTGVLVDTVHSGSLAERAGLRAGDAIVAIDGQPVSSTDDLAAAAERLARGTLVEIVFRRDGQTMSAHLHP